MKKQKQSPTLNKLWDFNDKFLDGSVFWLGHSFSDVFLLTWSKYLVGKELDVALRALPSKDLHSQCLQLLNTK